MEAEGINLVFYLAWCLKGLLTPGSALWRPQMFTGSPLVGSKGRGSRSCELWESVSPDSAPGGGLQSHQGRSLNIKVTDQHWDDSSVFGIAWFRKYLVAKNYCVVITATECVFALFIATASVVHLKK